MWCPKCKAKETKVTDSRVAGELACIRRRRACMRCEYRFTTREFVEFRYPRVVKKDGGRRQFCETKLRNGISRALEKRPVSSESFEKIIAQILKRIIETAEDEISSQAIGAIILHALKEIDHVAYIRFASVYQSFDNIDAFKQLIQDMQAGSMLVKE